MAARRRIPGASLALPLCLLIAVVVSAPPTREPPPRRAWIPEDEDWSSRYIEDRPDAKPLPVQPRRPRTYEELLARDEDVLCSQALSDKLADLGFPDVASSMRVHSSLDQRARLAVVLTPFSKWRRITGWRIDKRGDPVVVLGDDGVPWTLPWESRHKQRLESTGNGWPHFGTGWVEMSFDAELGRILKDLRTPADDDIDIWRAALMSVWLVRLGRFEEARQLSATARNGAQRKFGGTSADDLLMCGARYYRRLAEADLVPEDTRRWILGVLARLPWTEYVLFANEKLELLQLRQSLVARRKARSSELAAKWGGFTEAQVSRLPTEEQVEYWCWRLEGWRDSHLAMGSLGKFRARLADRDPGEQSELFALIRLGPNAVSSLIARIDDLTPTPMKDGEYVVTIGDCCFVATTLIACPDHVVVPMEPDETLRWPLEREDPALLRRDLEAWWVEVRMLSHEQRLVRHFHQSGHVSVELLVSQPETFLPEAVRQLPPEDGRERRIRMARLIQILREADQVQLERLSGSGDDTIRTIALHALNCGEQE